MSKPRPAMRQICDALNEFGTGQNFTFQDFYNTIILGGFTKAAVRTVLGSAVKHRYLKSMFIPGQKRKYIYTKVKNIPEEEMVKMMRKDPHVSKKTSTPVSKKAIRPAKMEETHLRVKVSTILRMESLIENQAVTIKALKAENVRFIDENAMLNTQIRILNDTKKLKNYTPPNLIEYENNVGG